MGADQPTPTISPLVVAIRPGVATGEVGVSYREGGNYILDPRWSQAGAPGPADVVVVERPSTVQHDQPGAVLVLVGPEGRYACQITHLVRVTLSSGFMPAQAGPLIAGLTYIGRPRLRLGRLLNAVVRAGLSSCCRTGLCRPGNCRDNQGHRNSNSEYDSGSVQEASLLGNVVLVSRRQVKAVLCTGFP